ncbi:MAG: hypothetical protein V4721_10350 [Bacteroidota bacterium]
MKTFINNKEHEVVYIDYQEGSVPHQVYTVKVENGCLYTWDFFANNGDKTDIRFYNSGFGGSRKKIQASNWIDEFIGQYWLVTGVKLNGKSNGIKLEKPLRIKGYSSTSINPFKIGEETCSREYCEECGCESTEFCYKHKYEDDEGNERWIHNDEYSG